MILTCSEKALKCNPINKTNAPVLPETPWSSFGSLCFRTSIFLLLVPVAVYWHWHSNMAKQPQQRSYYRKIRTGTTLFTQVGTQLRVMYRIHSQNGFAIKQVECSLKSSQIIGWKGFCYCSYAEKCFNILLLSEQLKKALFPLHFLVYYFSDFMRHFIIWMMGGRSDLVAI